MIKHLKNIFVYLFASYFLIAGAGYNVVNYCCQTCANEGIEAVAASSCFAVHHHLQHTNQFQQHDDLTCNDLNHHPENCHLFRLNTDIPSFQAMHQSDVKQFYTIDLFDLCSVFSIGKYKLSNQNDFSPPDNTVFRDGRLILTFHSVLLI